MQGLLKTHCQDCNIMRCLYVCVCACLHVCVADVKKPGAGRHSQYYRKYGNPNFGGK